MIPFLEADSLAEIAALAAHSGCDFHLPSLASSERLASLLPLGTGCRLPGFGCGVGDRPRIAAGLARLEESPGQGVGFALYFRRNPG